MGTGVFATCRACDYRVELRLGSSRSNYLTSTEWPVWCDTCGKMDTTNYEPPHLNWSSAMFRKRRTDNDEQTTEAGRDYHEVEAS